MLCNLRVWRMKTQFQLSSGVAEIASVMSELCGWVLCQKRHCCKGSSHAKEAVSCFELSIFLLKIIFVWYVFRCFDISQTVPSLRTGPGTPSCFRAPPSCTCMCSIKLKVAPNIWKTTLFPNRMYMFIRFGWHFLWFVYVLYLNSNQGYKYAYISLVTPW